MRLYSLPNRQLRKRRQLNQTLAKDVLLNMSFASYFFHDNDFLLLLNLDSCYNICIFSSLNIQLVSKNILVKKMHLWLKTCSNEAVNMHYCFNIFSDRNKIFCRFVSENEPRLFNEYESEEAAMNTLSNLLVILNSEK